MFLKLFIFLSSIISGFAQFYPGGGMAFGAGQAMAGMQNPRGMGDYYPMGGYPYSMPPRYMPNFYPVQQHYPGAMAFGAAVAGAESPLPPPPPPPQSFPPSLMPGSENTNENANTNVNINSGSYRRSLHNPSKEHGASRNINSNTNVNMSS